MWKCGQITLRGGANIFAGQNYKTRSALSRLTGSSRTMSAAPWPAGSARSQRLLRKALGPGAPSRGTGVQQLRLPGPPERKRPSPHPYPPHHSTQTQSASGGPTKTGGASVKRPLRTIVPNGQLQAKSSWAGHWSKCRPPLVGDVARLAIKDLDKLYGDQVGGARRRGQPGLLPRDMRSPPSPPRPRLWTSLR